MHNFFGAEMAGAAVQPLSKSRLISFIICQWRRQPAADGRVHGDGLEVVLLLLLLEGRRASEPWWLCAVAGACWSLLVRCAGAAAVAVARAGCDTGVDVLGLRSPLVASWSMRISRWNASAAMRDLHDTQSFYGCPEVVAGIRSWGT